MAIRFLEGFDSYSTTGNSLTGHGRKWPTASIGTFDVAAGRFGGYAVWMNSSFTRWIQTPVFGEPTLTVGCAVKFTAFPSIPTDGNQVFLSLYEGANLGINVVLTPLGELAIYLGGSQLDITSGLALTVNSWITVELSVTVHGSTGAYDLHVNGISVLSASGIDTMPGSNAWTDVIRIGKSANSAMLPMFDDLYINDDGSFLGSFKVQTIRPNADSAVDCTPSTGGDNYAMTDDNPVDDDSTYVEGGAGDTDLYDYQSIVASEIYAVQVNTIARVTDASPLDLALVAKSGSTTDAGTPHNVASTSYGWFADIWALNPDTGLPWEASEINAAQFGFDIS